MSPVEFSGVNVVFGANQPEYRPLPAMMLPDNGQAITCWQLSPEELAEVNKTGKIYLSQYTFGQALQPVMLVTNLSDLVEVKG